MGLLHFSVAGGRSVIGHVKLLPSGRVLHPFVFFSSGVFFAIGFLITSVSLPRFNQIKKDDCKLVEWRTEREVGLKVSSSKSCLCNLEYPFVG